MTWAESFPGEAEAPPHDSADWRYLGEEDWRAIERNGAHVPEGGEA